MGTRQQTNTKQQILDATERIIYAKGLARTTTKEIAYAAGYAEGTLYKHFEHKEELFLAVIQQHLPSFIEATGEFQPGELTITSNLERIAIATIQYYDKIVPLAVAFCADTNLLDSYRKLLKEVQGGPQRILERIAVYVQGEQELGRIDRQHNALCVASLLVGPCYQYVFNRFFMGENAFTLTDEQFVADLVHTLMVGLTPLDQSNKE